MATSVYSFVTGSWNCAKLHTNRTRYRRSDHRSHYVVSSEAGSRWPKAHWAHICSLRSEPSILYRGLNFRAFLVPLRRALSRLVIKVTNTYLYSVACSKIYLPCMSRCEGTDQLKLSGFQIFRPQCLSTVNPWNWNAGFRRKRPSNVHGAA